MRVVMFGFQTWGRKTLQALVDLDHEVVLAVTHPASEHSYRAIFSDPVEELARAHGIPVHLTERVDSVTIDLVKRAAPDVIVVNSWYTWMPPELYNLPPHGTLNLHDSLLPKFTGFSPVLWALISGESEFGLTVHRMDDGLDTGDILIQHSLPIKPTDTGTELVLRGMDLIPGALRDALSALESGTAVWRPQNKAERTYFHKRSERDSLIDWGWPAEDLERFVRALSAPYPRPFTFYRVRTHRGARGARFRGPLRRNARPRGRAGGRRRGGIGAAGISRRQPRPGCHVGPYLGRRRAPRGRVLPARRVPERPDLIRRK